MSFLSDISNVDNEVTANLPAATSFLATLGAISSSGSLTKTEKTFGIAIAASQAAESFPNVEVQAAGGLANLVLNLIARFIVPSAPAPAAPAPAAPAPAAPAPAAPAPAASAPAAPAPAASAPASPAPASPAPASPAPAAPAAVPEALPTGVLPKAVIPKDAEPEHSKPFGERLKEVFKP